jgi:hypothetical protein
MLYEFAEGHSKSLEASPLPIRGREGVTRRMSSHIAKDLPSPNLSLIGRGAVVLSLLHLVFCALRKILVTAKNSKILVIFTLLSHTPICYTLPRYAYRH